MSKFQLYSDLHLEFGHTFMPEWDGSSDYLLLAGDIHVTKKPMTYQWALEMLAKGGWKQIFLIAGNHEFYNNEWFKTLTQMARFDDEVPNVTFLDKEFVDLGDCVLFGGTMWTDLSDPLAGPMAKLKMNDYHIIDKNTRPLNPKDTTEDFYKFNVSLRKCLESVDKPVVVMTHMSPHELSGAKEYKGDVLNAAYYTNQSSFMEDEKLKVWVHGHMHNSSDYVVNDTRVLANPYGYHGQSFKEVNPTFDPNGIGFSV